MGRRKGQQSDKPSTLPTEFNSGFLATLDGRCELARALKANYQNIVSDIGGADGVGHVKAALIERFVWLEAIVQTIEQEMATGKIDRADAVGKWVQAVNALSGLAKTIGIERRTRTDYTVLEIPTNGKA